MDYRERKYYLVSLNDGTGYMWWINGHDDDGRKYYHYWDMIKKKVPSIKKSKPYNHFKHNNHKKDNYDGEIKEIGYVQFILSCRKECSSQFERIMSEIKRKDKCVVCKEINKKMCGQ